MTALPYYENAKPFAIDLKTMDKQRKFLVAQFRPEVAKLTEEETYLVDGLIELLHQFQDDYELGVKFDQADPMGVVDIKVSLWKDISVTGNVS